MLGRVFLAERKWLVEPSGYAVLLCSTEFIDKSPTGYRGVIDGQ